MAEEEKVADINFNDFIEGIDVFFFKLDLQGKWVYLNKACEDIFGFPKEEMLGRSFFDYVLRDEQSKCKLFFEDIVKNGTAIHRIEVKIRTKNDEDKILGFNPYLVKDKNGIAIGMMGMGRDITERKRAEDELKEAYTKLKETQFHFMQAAKMAAIGQLVSSVIHEINSPLSGVINNVQLIKIEAEQKKEFNLQDFRYLLDIIEESALRCTKITRSLLDFSHASKRRFAPFSVNEAIERNVVLIEHEMKLQNIIINRELESNLPLISGDFQLLQQVIFDIISNAKWAIQKKYENQGGLITIKTYYEQQTNNAYILVSDTGIGIPQENIDKIFEPYFTTKPIGEGTGLGLSIVYNIIKEHKGTIEVDSEVNKGTTFKISLPALT